MPGWKNILDSEEKKRAAAFEAQMLATLAKDKPAAPVTPPPVVPGRDGIQITVTANGQSTPYNNLEAVPAPVRQQILIAWQPLLSGTGVPPVLSGQREQHGRDARATTRSRRVAMTLNLFLPGAGQFYLGQPVAGSVYAFGFIGSFVASLVIFLRGYGSYIQISSGGDILEGDNLERLTNSFHTGWLIGLQVVAIAIYLASAIHLSRSRAQ